MSIGPPSRRVDTLGQYAFRSNGAHPGTMGATQHTTATYTGCHSEPLPRSAERARCLAEFETAELAALSKRPARKAAISRRAGTGRQCTSRAFDLDLMDLAPSQPAPQAQPPHTAAKTPAARAPAEAAGDPPRSVSVSTGRRSMTFNTPTEGVPERLMLKTPALRSRLGRTPGLAVGWPEAGMTPVEGVPERVIERHASTAVKAPRAIDAGPRVQPGLNAAPPVPSPERSTPGAGSGGFDKAAMRSGESAAGPSPAQLRSDSDSDGCDASAYSDVGEDGADLHAIARTSMPYCARELNAVSMMLSFWACLH